MPFNVTSAARFERRVTLKFNREQLEIHYNAGEKYKEYQVKAQALDQEFTDLQRRLQVQNFAVVHQSENEEGHEEDGVPKSIEDAYEDLKKALSGARRRICDNLCFIITEWDLEGDRTYIKSLMDNEDRKRLKKEDPEAWAAQEGHGPIPIEGAWTDALPLPDEFVLEIAQAITQNFESGGAGGKGRLRAS